MNMFSAIKALNVYIQCTWHTILTVQVIYMMHSSDNQQLQFGALAIVNGMSSNTGEYTKYAKPHIFVSDIFCDCLVL